MFDLDQFIADCRVALAADKSHKHVRDVVPRAVADPASVLKGLGEPNVPASTSSISPVISMLLNVVWAPMMTVVPHNHSMWAVIGIYTGREDNIFGAACPAAWGRSRLPAPRRCASETRNRSDPTSFIQLPIQFHA